MNASRHAPRPRQNLTLRLSLAVRSRQIEAYNDHQASTTMLVQAIDTRTGTEFPEPVRWLEQILGCAPYSSLGGNFRTALLTPSG